MCKCLLIRINWLKEEIPKLCQKMYLCKLEYERTVNLTNTR